MQINVYIDCVDGSFMGQTFKTRAEALEYLKKNDHEGSTISLNVDIGGEECYEFLSTVQGES